MFSYRRNPCTCTSCPEHGTASRRLRRYSRNPGGFRRNLLPLSRRMELQDKSPGNFRRPTLEVTKKYLDDWRDSGIEKPSDFTLTQFNEFARDRGTTPILERAQEINRFDEASHWWGDYENRLGLYTADPTHYDKPRFSTHVEGDFRDYGDYAELDGSQAYHYLYQFLHRNAQKRADGETIDDVRQPPFKWRYREAVLNIGPEKADKLVKRTFGAFGLRAPKNYLTTNIYDDIDSLFPAPASSRRWKRRNPW